jgi:hypothetical protein
MTAIPPHQHAAHTAHLRALLARHIQTVGYWCPGYAHHAHTSHDLTADPTIPHLVLCHRCHTRKRDLGDT